MSHKQVGLKSSQTSAPGPEIPPISATHSERSGCAALSGSVMPTLRDPVDRSTPGSSVLGISQARTLEWVAFPPPGGLPDSAMGPVSLGSLPSAVSESEVTQSCPTLCDSMDCSPPGFSIHGVFQARTLECVALSFSRGSSPPKD